MYLNDMYRGYHVAFLATQNQTTSFYPHSILDQELHALENSSAKYFWQKTSSSATPADRLVCILPCTLQGKINDMNQTGES